MSPDLVHGMTSGWASATLGEVIEMHYGKGLVQERRQPGPCPVYGSNGVVGEHAAAATDGPTIIVGRKGSVGEVHFSGGACWPIDTTYFITRFGPFDPKFLYHLLKFLRLGELDKSTAVPGLTRGDAYAVEVPIPPMAEQKRIVAKVEEVLARVNAARERLAKLPTILERFRRSVLAAACSGRLTADWRDVTGSVSDLAWLATTLEDVCDTVSDGDHLPPPKSSDGVPFLTIGNISAGTLDFRETRFVSKSYFDRIKPERVPKPGDVLYTVVGATIGIPVLVDVDRPFCFQRHIAILKPSELITSEFLKLLLSTPDIFREAWDRTTGTAQPTLPLGGLRSIPVRVPPLAEQREIVRRVHAILTLSDQATARVSSARTRAETLLQATLAKAFRGELVPTEAELAEREGREFESGEQLLERFRLARATAAGSNGNDQRTKRARPGVRRRQAASRPEGR